MTVARGNPQIVIRLEPEILELLHQRAEPVHGRAGGAALFVRELIYRELGKEMPRQYGVPSVPAGDRPDASHQERREEIRELLAGGMTQADVARHLGMSRQ